MSDQLPALVILAPLFGAVLVGISTVTVGGTRLVLPIVLGSLVLSTVASLGTLMEVIENGEIVYLLGSWPRTIGIEFRIDPLNALLLVMVSMVALITAVYSKPCWVRRMPSSPMR